MKAYPYINPLSGAETKLVPGEGGRSSWEQTSAPTVPVLRNWEIGTLDQIERFLIGRGGFAVTETDSLNTSASYLVSAVDGGEDMGVIYPKDSFHQAISISSTKPVCWERFLAVVRTRIPKIIPLSSIETKIDFRRTASGELFTIHLRRAEPWAV